MRRNVRRLNREIGNHGSSLPVSTQVSLPLTLPTSYQPRSLEKKVMDNINDGLPSNVAKAPSEVVQGPMPSALNPPMGGSLSVSSGSSADANAAINFNNQKADGE